MKTTYEHRLDEADEPTIYEVEYRRTAYHPAEPSWHGGAGSPAEGGEVIIESIQPEVPANSPLWFDIYEYVEANGD